jgi:flavin-dependent dehydrogenase
MIKKGLKGARMVSKVRGCVPVRPGGYPGKGRILLAGEAGRLTDPLLGFGMKNAVISGSLAGSSAATNDPLLFYIDALEAEMLKDLRRRMSARTRIADRLTDRTIEDLLKVAGSILENGDTALFFDPERRWKEIWKTVRKLPRKSDLILALRYILPILAANFSFDASKPRQGMRGGMTDMGSLRSDVQESEV